MPQAPGQLDERTQKGIKAIKYLQGMAQIDETDEKALAGWRGMTEHEQDFTLEFCGHMEKRVEFDRAYPGQRKPGESPQNCLNRIRPIPPQEN